MMIHLFINYVMFRIKCIRLGIWKNDPNVSFLIFNSLSTGLETNFKNESECKRKQWTTTNMHVDMFSFGKQSYNKNQTFYLDIVSFIVLLGIFYKTKISHNYITLTYINKDYWSLWNLNLISVKKLNQLYQTRNKEKCSIVRWSKICWCTFYNRVL